MARLHRRGAGGPGGLGAASGPWGVFTAVLLVLTGVGLALGHFQAVANLVETAYGVAFLVKLGVVATAFACGALARRRVELVVAAGALATATVLVSLLPPG